MPPICHKCGVTGYPELLLSCKECKTSVEHIYCLAEFPVVEKAGWICELCKPRSSNIIDDDREHPVQQLYYSDINLMPRDKNQKAIRGNLVPNSQQEKTESEVSTYTSPVEGEGRKSKRRRLILADEDSLDQELQPDHALTKKATQLPSGQNMTHLPTVSFDEVTIGSQILANETSTSEATVQEKIQNDCAGRAPTKRSSEIPPKQVLASQPLHTVSCAEVTIWSQIDAHKISTSEATAEERVQDDSSLTKKAADLSSEQKLASPTLHTVSSDEVTIETRIVAHETSTSEVTVQEKFHDDQSNEHLYSVAQPIAGHVWRGYISFGDEKYGPLTAHLSSMACERVYHAARLLPSVLHMEKFSRLDFCPKSFKNSPPTDGKIGLYFLPEGKMIEPVCDQLVSDAIQKDLLFKCTLDGVELLLFSSTILPRRNHRFLGKHYLWGAFRGRQASISTLSADIRPKPTEARKEIQRTEISNEHSRSKVGSKPIEVREEINRMEVFNEHSGYKEKGSEQRMEVSNEHSGDKEDTECLDDKSPDYSTSPHSVLEHPTLSKNKLTDEVSRSKASSKFSGDKKRIQTHYKEPEELEEGEICDMDREELEEGEICDMEREEEENPEDFDDDKLFAVVSSIR